MEALTLKELKKIEKWFADHEDDMTTQDNKIYEKINMIIEEMSDEEDCSIKTILFDDDMQEESEEDDDNYYYED